MNRAPGRRRGHGPPGGDHAAEGEDRHAAEDHRRQEQRAGRQAGRDEPGTDIIIVCQSLLCSCVTRKMKLNTIRKFFCPSPILV